MVHVPVGYGPLSGSELSPEACGELVGPIDPDETVAVSVCVRRRPDGPPMPDHDHWLVTPPRSRQFPSRDEFAVRHGAAQADLDAVVRFATAAGLEVKLASAVGRTVVLSGSIKHMSEAFAVRLSRYDSKAGSFRSHEGPVHLPSELAGVVEAVFGLNTRTEGGHNAGGDPPGFTTTIPPTVAQLYNFPPTPPDAAGTILGIIEFSGMSGIGSAPCGWNQSDINDTLLFFGITTPFTPVDVPVTGSNSPGDLSNPHGPDSEVLLDICVAAAVAPGAKIQVYWGSDVTSPADWLAVLNAIIAASGAPLPHVLSNSWVLASGDDALSASKAQIQAISSKFQDLATLGVTVFSASGDDGARSLTTDGKAHVQYPASDPWVTSCGGTAISTNPTYVEWVWNDTNPNNSDRPYATGGGVSAFFSSIPPWQQLVTVPRSINDGTTIGRGVPDVAGNASVGSGYPLTLYGRQITDFGTSAVAPLYAGLAALLVNRLGGRIGFLNPTLYAFRDSVCRDIDDQLFPGSPPDNGVPSFSDPVTGRFLPAVKGYPSGPGWDACTGLGVIDGGALLAALQGVFDKRCQFILDRTQFGKNEVQAAGTPTLVQNAFYVIIDGFTASQLNITSIDPTKPPVVTPKFTSTLPGIGVVATSLLAEDVSLPQNTPQRFTWICAASFPDLTAFNSLPASATLGASMTATTGDMVSDAATVELVLESDPYELDGPVSWLSTDLRVFQIAGTNAALPGLPTVKLGNTGNATNDATGFIQAVIGGFNADTTPPPNHPFDQISTDEQVSQVTIAEFDASGQPLQFRRRPRALSVYCEFGSCTGILPHLPGIDNLDGVRSQHLRGVSAASRGKQEHRQDPAVRGRRKWQCGCGSMLCRAEDPARLPD